MGTQKSNRKSKKFRTNRKTRSKRQRGGDDAYELLRASGVGDIKTVKRLLDAGINVNVDDVNIDHQGYTALILASKYGHKDIVVKLLEAGANVNTGGAGNMTALLWATVEGHAHIVEILLQQPGIEINASDMWGKTSLENASGVGDTEIVKMLLDAGANIDQALIQAVIFEDASEHGLTKIVKMLLKAGAHVNESDADGTTALMFASVRPSLYVGQGRSSEHGLTRIVKILLAQEGINVNLWNNEGETAIILASQNGHIEIVKMLLKAGAHVNVEEDEDAMDVEILNLDHHSALMMASYEGHTEIVKILLDAGAHVNTVANDGYDTAITLAYNRGHDKIVELLIRKGATIPEDNQYQELRDKKEEIIKGKLAIMNVIATKGRTNFRGMPQYAAEFMGGKRKTRKSKKSKRKTRRK